LWFHSYPSHNKTIFIIVVCWARAAGGCTNLIESLVTRHLRISAADFE
jgi:hypothetical protein